MDLVQKSKEDTSADCSFGEDKDGEGEEGYWHLLPSEIYEMIFKCYKNRDDYKSAVAVNKQWRDVICALRTYANFQNRQSMNCFQWSLFYNVHSIQVTYNASPISLSSVSTRVTHLNLCATVLDYQHLNISTMTATSVEARHLAQYLSVFGNIQILKIKNMNRSPANHSVGARLCGLTNMERLTIEESYISWPEQRDSVRLADMSRLRTLNLKTDETVRGVTEHMSRLTSLSTLKLSDNDDALPDWVLAMKNLRRLAVTGAHNNPNETPIDISSLTHLTNLSDLSIRNRPVRNYTAVSCLTNLQALCVLSSNLDEVGEELLSLTGLESLNFGNNSIRRIPHSVTCLQRVTSLNLILNEIKDLIDLSPLTKLTSFNIGHNKLSELRVEALPVSLMRLNLAYNNLGQLNEPHLRRYFTRLGHLGLQRINQ